MKISHQYSMRYQIYQRIWLFLFEAFIVVKKMGLIKSTITVVNPESCLSLCYFEKHKIMTIKSLTINQVKFDRSL